MENYSENKKTGFANTFFGATDATRFSYTPLNKLDLQTSEDTLACYDLDAGRKSRKSDDAPAAHLFERVILKIRSSFPEDSIRSDKSVFTLERASV